MIRPLLKKIFFSGLSVVGADKRKLRELAGSDRLTVLNLHRVSPEPDPYWSPMLPSLFEDLARWLADNFFVSTFRGSLEAKGDRPVAVLSFDDGYYDFIEYALPILERFKLPANMNVIPSCAESGKPIWNVRLYDFLRVASVSEIREIQIPGFSATLESDSASAKLKFGLAISRYLKHRSKNAREVLWRDIDAIIESKNVPTTRMMSTDEIKQIADRVELGAHSYSHESMGFETDEFFSEDLGRCEAYFNDKIELPLSIYAFPNGSYRMSQIELLRSRGIKHILLVDEQTGVRNSDVLTRRTMYGDSRAELYIRALGI